MATSEANHPSGNLSPESIETNLRRLDKIAWYLDQSIGIPGGFRIGLDGLIGLIPGVGDILTFSVSSYIVNEARRLGAPKTLLIKMIWNISLETIIGIIPFFGDLFDFYYKANIRNITLLRNWLGKLKQTD